MVYRIYVEKKPGLDNEARSLLGDARDFLGIRNLERVRLLNRYDAENITPELFDTAVREVFSEPQLDDAAPEFDAEGATAVFAVEFLPGQFDQRADSAVQNRFLPTDIWAKICGSADSSVIPRTAATSVRWPLRLRCICMNRKNFR